MARIGSVEVVWANEAMRFRGVDRLARMVMDWGFREREIDEHEFDSRLGCSCLGLLVFCFYIFV